MHRIDGFRSGRLAGAGRQAGPGGLSAVAWLLFAVLALIAGRPAAQEAGAGLDDAFERDVLIVVADRLGCHRFEVYLAVSPAQRRRGLMYVRSLPERAGMLFVHEYDDRHSMWMKNTFIPLDMLFVRADGSVASIVRDTEPQSLRSIEATEPVRYVLELNAGVTEALSIGENSYLLRD